MYYSSKRNNYLKIFPILLKKPPNYRGPEFEMKKGFIPLKIAVELLPRLCLLFPL